MKSKYFPYQCGLNLPGQMDITKAYSSLAAKTLSYFFFCRNWKETDLALKEAHILDSVVPLVEMSLQKFLHELTTAPIGPIRVSEGPENTFKISFQDKSALLCRENSHSISVVPEVMKDSCQNDWTPWLQHFETRFTPNANMRLMSWRAGRFFVPLWCLEKTTPDNSFLPTMNNIARGLSLLLTLPTTVRVMPMQVVDGQPTWAQKGAHAVVISNNTSENREKYEHIIEHTFKSAAEDEILHKGGFVSAKQTTPIFQFTTTNFKPKGSGHTQMKYLKDIQKYLPHPLNV